MVEAHAHDGVAGLDQREVRRQIGVRARMGLHIGELGAVELAGAVAREVLDDVDLLASAVVALAGVAFRVLVGEDAAHGLHDGQAREVLGRDELDAAALAGKLGAESARNLRVGFAYILQRHVNRSFQSLEIGLVATVAQ